MTQVIVFGDVGGQFNAFQQSLANNGIDMKKFVIPEETVIVQVGDLIHRGQDSDKVVEMVHRFMENNPSQWYQLIGNHESMHIEDTEPFYKCNCSPQTIKTINSWWETKQLHVAVAFAHDKNPYYLRNQTLVTHAGVTSRWWRRAGKADAATTAKFLNNMRESGFHDLNSYGVMMGMEKANFWAGPWWALSTREVYSSWDFLAHGEIPFNQIHGHTSPIFWDKKISLYDLSRFLHIDVENRISYFSDHQKQATFISVDPGYGEKQEKTPMPFGILKNVRAISL